jgi:glycosyltransferase involved in cell wall biosynthesis
MLVISALRVDPRVEREARALAKCGYRVCVIAPDISHPPLRERPLDWGDGITFDILDVSAANFSTSPPYLAGERFLAAALQYKPLAFHCHDLNTSIIGLAASRYLGCKVVCYFHEWFSENATWSVDGDCWVPHDDFKRDIFKAAESLVMRQADSVITVCDSIARELNSSNPEWRRNVSVIRNIPDINLMPTKNYSSIKKQIGVDKNSFVVLYQGGVGKTRWLEPVIEALKYSPKTILVIRGPAIDLFEADYKKIATQFGVENRLYLLPPIPSRDVVAAANGADAGIYTVANICKNFFYALPNKLFEYIGAELPLLSANYPEPSSMIKNNKLGLLFDPSSPLSIAEAFEGMKNYQVRDEFKKNVIEFKLALSANVEMDKLVDIYDDMRGYPR